MHRLQIYLRDCSSNSHASHAAFRSRSNRMSFLKDSKWELQAHISVTSQQAAVHKPQLIELHTDLLSWHWSCSWEKRGRHSWSPQHATARSSTHRLTAPPEAAQWLLLSSVLVSLVSSSAYMHMHTHKNNRQYIKLQAIRRKQIVEVDKQWLHHSTTQDLFHSGSPCYSSERHHWTCRTTWTPLTLQTAWPKKRKLHEHWSVWHTH